MRRCGLGGSEPLPLPTIDRGIEGPFASEGGKASFTSGRGAGGAPHLPVRGRKVLTRERERAQIVGSHRLGARGLAQLLRCRDVRVCTHAGAGVAAVDQRGLAGG